jgi:hypothetical protein
MRKGILKIVQNALSALAVSWVATSCQTHPGPAVVPIPFDERELADSWMGFNDRDATCYELILKEAGNGVLYSRFQEETSATNTISHWEVQGNVLHCAFLQDGSPTSAALLECNIKKTLLVATLTGVGGWKDNIQFRRIRFIEKSLSEAKTYEGVP